MTNKEKYISAIIGIAIGSTLGILMSSSIIKRNNDYEKLKKENQELRKLIYTYENYTIESL
jgi:mannitol-specific phosphotransferase system IIBC component